MKFLSLAIEGTPILAPSEVQNIVNKSGNLGQNIIRLGIEIVLIGIILLSFSYLVWGGIKVTISRGDKQMVQQAREQIVYAVVGLIIAFLSFFTLSVVSKIFNLSVFGF